jgi:hypothetical protein
MKIKQRIIVVLTFIVVTFSGYIFLSKSYYPTFPIQGISESEAIILLNSKNQQLTRGWIYKEQLGSGYFFLDHSNSLKG